MFREDFLYEKLPSYRVGTFVARRLLFEQSW